MRTLPQALQDHLDTGTTTLCHCWRVALADGRILGFTDHDRTLIFSGVTYEAESGFAATEIESSLGLSIDNLEAQGALSSESLSEEDLAAGVLDNAAVEVWLVNWQDVGQRLLLRSGNIGEVTRGRLAFTAELRGLAHALNQPKGRMFQYGCDARVGDTRCGVNLDQEDYAADVTVASAAEARRMTVSGAETFPKAGLRGASRPSRRAQTRAAPPRSSFTASSPAAPSSSCGSRCHRRSLQATW